MRAGVILALPLILLAAGCGGADRSVSAYCETWESEKQAYVQKYGDLADSVEAQDEPLVGALLGAAAGMQAIGDLRVMFAKLEGVAPEEIRPDVVVVQDSLEKAIDNAGENALDPLAGLTSSLANTLTSMGSWERVAAWTSENCGAA